MTFTYQNNTFSINPINLTIKHNELLFLINDNNNKKSTLTILLTNLYQPQNNKILLNNKPINDKQPKNYRKLFSTIFTDI